MASQADKLSDLHGLIIEHVEKVLLSGQHSSWLVRSRRKLIKSLSKELGQVTVEGHASRLADFYVEFQQRGGIAGDDPESSHHLRLSFKNSRSHSRLSKSSDTAGTKQTLASRASSKDSSLSFDVSLSSSNKSLGCVSDNDDELPIMSPLAKITKGASNPSGRAPSRDERLKSLVEEMQGIGLSMKEIHAKISQSDLGQSIAAVGPRQTDTGPSPRSLASSGDLSLARPPLLPGSPAASERSMGCLPGPRMRHDRKPVGFSPTGEATLSYFALTHLDSIRCSLEWTMKHWNSVRVNSCCPFHSYVNIAKICILHMGKEECIPLWSPLTGWRCGECSCLNHDQSDSCDLCQEGRGNDDKEMSLEEDSVTTTNDSLTTPASE